MSHRAPAAVDDAPSDALRELRVALLGALRGGFEPQAIGLRDFPGDPAGGAEDEIRGHLSAEAGGVAPSRARFPALRSSSKPAVEPRTSGLETT